MTDRKKAQKIIDSAFDATEPYHRGRVELQWARGDIASLVVRGRLHRVPTAAIPAVMAGDTVEYHGEIEAVGTVPVSAAADYRGRDMRWTETRSGSYVSDGDVEVYHFSDHEITAFVPGQTCFWPDAPDVNPDGERLYRFRVPAGRRVHAFDSGEVRIELREGDEIEACERFEHRSFTVAAGYYRKSGRL